VNQWLERNGYDVDRLWNEIDDVVIKTLISAHTSLRHNYRSCFPSHIRGSACFEVLGFDIVMDSKLRPLVLEVRGAFKKFCNSAITKNGNITNYTSFFNKISTEFNAFATFFWQTVHSTKIEIF